MIWLLHNKTYNKTCVTRISKNWSDCADWSVHWSHKSFCRFCHALAHKVSSEKYHNISPILSMVLLQLYSKVKSRPDCAILQSTLFFFGVLLTTCIEGLIISILNWQIHSLDYDSTHTYYVKCMSVCLCVCFCGIFQIQGPVVQSVVNLTSSLRVILLTVLADSIHNILIFFAEKMWVAFALQKLLTFFQQKISAYLHITWCKF